MTKTIECKKCGHLNTEDGIDYTSGTCGESCGCESYEYYLTCSACDNEIYSGSEWGQFDRTEVFNEIIDELAEEKEE